MDIDNDNEKNENNIESYHGNFIIIPNYLKSKYYDKMNRKMSVQILKYDFNINDKMWPRKILEPTF